MSILDRHIGRHIITGSIMALLMLVGIDLVFTFVGEASDIGEGDYSLGKSLLYVILTAPRRAYDFMPMAAITGSLVMLGGLAGQNEFTAMRSAGVSTRQIAGAVLKGGAVLIGIVIILGEGIAPYTEPWAQQMRTFARTQSTALKSQHGIWIRDANSFINIGQVHPDGKLYNLDIYRLDDNYRLQQHTRAKRAEYKDGTWTLYNLTRTRMQPQRLQTITDQQAPWDVLLEPELIKVLAVKPEQLPIWRLHTYMAYLRTNGLDTRAYEFALWGKITAPFVIPVMLIIAIPFIFSPLRTTGSGQRILIGIILGISYYLLSHLMVRAGQLYALNPILSNTLPIAIFLTAGWLGWRTIR